MENLKINIDNVFGFVSKDEIFSLKNIAFTSQQALYNKSGKGNDFLGWVNLPTSIPEAQ